MNLFIKKLLLPNQRTLFFTVLIFWSLLSVFSAFFYGLKQNVDLFLNIWIIIPVIFVTYILYGYIRIIVIKSIDAKRNIGFFKSLKEDKKFRSIFLSFFGIIVSFYFAIQYTAKGFMDGSGFYWFLSEFYLVAAILKLYLNTIVETDYSRLGKRAYIIIYSVDILLAIAVAGITFYVIFYDAIFEKSYYLITTIAIFTFYKLISASINFHHARKDKSRLYLAKSFIALSSALLSIYTLAVALLVLISQNPEMKRFSPIGFVAAIAIFVLAVIGLVNSIREYVIDKKKLMN